MPFINTKTSIEITKEQELLDYYCKHADVDAVIMIHPQVEEYDFHEIPILILGQAFWGMRCPLPK